MNATLGLFITALCALQGAPQPSVPTAGQQPAAGQKLEPAGATMKLASVMSAADYQQTGIASLTTEQTAALDQWVAKYTLQVQRQTRDIVSLESKASGNWEKTAVTPVLLVKSGIGGNFVPMEGSALFNSWTRDEVKPVVIVEPSLGGYSTQKDPYAKPFSRNEVTPVALVEPALGGFKAMLVSQPQANSAAASGQRVGQGTGSSEPTAHVIESKVEGQFEGFDGDTIIKLDNGQIWQQIDYQYAYSYKYRPEVFIWSQGGIWKMRVEGVDKKVSVTRLR